MSASLTPVDLLYGADEETLREVVRALPGALQLSPVAEMVRAASPA